MVEIPEYVDGRLNLAGAESLVAKTVEAAGGAAVDRRDRLDLASIDSAFAIALHMHQPLIPAGGDDLRTAEIISNLAWMMGHPDIGDNHNVRVRLRADQRRFAEDLSRLTVPTDKDDDNGDKILKPLSEVATVDPGTGPSSIRRRDLVASTSVYFIPVLTAARGTRAMRPQASLSLARTATITGRSGTCTPMK